MQSSSLERGVISIVIAQSVERPTTDQKVGSSTRSLVNTKLFFWIFIFFELLFKGVDGLWMGLKDVWSAWRPFKIKPFFLLDHRSHITYKASTLLYF
jgi:hypothetical protein